MRYVKAWFVAAVGAMASVVFIGGNTASAAVLCKKQGEGTPTGITCPTGSAYEGETNLHAVVVSEKAPVILKTTILEQEWKQECPESTLKGKTGNEGGEGQAVSITVEVLTFLMCPSCEIIMLKNGFLTISWNSGTHNGTVTSNGTEMTTSCFIPGLGKVHCIYRTEKTHLGTIVGGSPAILEVKALVPKVPTEFFCSEGLTWEGSYTVTEPSPLYIADKT